jgi:SAM-dependent methyltransferase
MMSEFWNQKYNTTDYFYGTKPNAFIKEQLEKMSPGKILFPAEGEGRNAIFAAKLGWDVSAFDPSSVAREKALNLAQQNQVSINYLLLDYQNAQFEANSFDVIATTFSHMPELMRKNTHQKFLEWLKPGGILVFEAFSKEQLHYNSGGPKDLDMLYSVNDLNHDFAQSKIQHMKQSIKVLSEGLGHQGEASTIECIVVKRA